MNTAEPVSTEPQSDATQEQKRPYSVPQLTIHGTVVELTLGKTGQQPDGDAAGSFVPQVN